MDFGSGTSVLRNQSRDAVFLAVSVHLPQKKKRVTAAIKEFFSISECCPLHPSQKVGC